MARDYDAPRDSGDEDEADSIEELRAAKAGTGQRPELDDDVNSGAESVELPGADLSDESLVIRVVPKAADEFTCTSCFLVFHNSARSAPGSDVCRDCA